MIQKLMLIALGALLALRSCEIDALRRNACEARLLSQASINQTDALECAR